MGQREARGRGWPPEARARGNRTMAERAIAAYAEVLPMIQELRARGLNRREIADHLNAEGLTTRQGTPWHRTQVGRVLRRAGQTGSPGGGG